MTSSNGNIFHITGPLWGEFTGRRWIPLAKASDAELWCLNKRFSKQSRRRRFDTPPRLLWRHSNESKNQSVPSRVIHNSNFRIIFVFISLLFSSSFYILINRSQNSVAHFHSTVNMVSLERWAAPCHYWLFMSVCNLGITQRVTWLQILIFIRRVLFSRDTTAGK